MWQNTTVFEGKLRKLGKSLKGLKVYEEIPVQQHEVYEDRFAKAICKLRRARMDYVIQQVLRLARSYKLLKSQSWRQAPHVNVVTSGERHSGSSSWPSFGGFGTKVFPYQVNRLVLVCDQMRLNGKFVSCINQRVRKHLQNFMRTQARNYCLSYTNKPRSFVPIKLHFVSPKWRRSPPSSVIFSFSWSTFRGWTKRPY
jgi:hypothetical protein